MGAVGDDQGHRGAGRWTADAGDLCDAEERAALGRALEARCPEVAALIAARAFPGAPVALSDFDSSVVATAIIARWLIGGHGATGAEHESLARNGDAPLMGQSTLGDMAKSYLAWRDVTVELLRAEAERLGTSARTVRSAQTVVRSSCDASLVR